MLISEKGKTVLTMNRPIISCKYSGPAGFHQNGTCWESMGAFSATNEKLQRALLASVPNQKPGFFTRVCKKIWSYV